MVTVKLSLPHGESGKLTQEDVWGSVDLKTGEQVSKGMIVARGLPSVDATFTQERKDSIIAKGYPSVCPVWGDELPYKSVTVICHENQVGHVSYWLEYVHGAGCVVDVKELADGRVALRSDYQCW